MGSGCDCLLSHAACWWRRPRHCSQLTARSAGCWASCGCRSHLSSSRHRQIARHVWLQDVGSTLCAWPCGIAGVSKRASDAHEVRTCNHMIDSARVRSNDITNVRKPPSTLFPIVTVLFIRRCCSHSLLARRGEDAVAPHACAGCCINRGNVHRINCTDQIESKKQHRAHS